MLPLNGGQGRSCITQLPGGHDLGPVVPSAGPDSSSWTWNSLSLARPTREMFGHSSWGPKPLGSSHSWVLIKTLQYHGLPPPSCCHALCPLTARGLLTQLALGLAGDDHSIFFFSVFITPFSNQHGDIVSSWESPYRSPNQSLAEHAQMATAREI